MSATACILPDSLTEETDKDALHDPNNVSADSCIGLTFKAIILQFVKIACMSQNCGGRRLGFSDVSPGLIVRQPMLIMVPAPYLQDPAYDYFSPYNLAKQDGIEQDNSSPELACRTMITMPTWLSDGEYVLGWIMYGVHVRLTLAPSTCLLILDAGLVQCAGRAPAFLQELREHCNFYHAMSRCANIFIRSSAAARKSLKSRQTAVHSNGKAATDL